MAVLGSIFAGSWAAMSGGEKPKTAAGPPINASSKEEGDFVQYVIRNFSAVASISREERTKLENTLVYTHTAQ
jgi:hypothetical protein